MVNETIIKVGDILPQYVYRKVWKFNTIVSIIYGVVVKFTVTGLPRTISLNKWGKVSDVDQVLYGRIAKSANLTKTKTKSIINFSKYPLTANQREHLFKTEPILKFNYDTILDYIKHESSKTLHSRQKETLDFSW